MLGPSNSISEVTQKFPSSIYKLGDLDPNDFTAVYVSKVLIFHLQNAIFKVGKLFQIKKFTLVGLDHFNKETILGMTPVLNQVKQPNC